MHGNTEFYIDQQELLQAICSGELERATKAFYRWFPPGVEQFPANIITRNKRTARQARGLEFLGILCHQAFLEGVPVIRLGILSERYAMHFLRFAFPEDFEPLFLEMLSDFCAAFREAEPLPQHPQLQKACLYIGSHLYEALDVGAVAKAAGLSVSRLNTLFKELMGQTVHQYLLHKRIEAAKTLLTSTCQSISEIGELLVFSSASHFTQTFRKAVGCTPGQYRKQQIRPVK